MKKIYKKGLSPKFISTSQPPFTYMTFFRDRLDAGEKLATKLTVKNRGVVLAIPRGGVPVGYAISRRLEIPLDLIITRKLPIPYNPEAGFGAATLQEVVFNQPLLQSLNSEEIQAIIKQVQREIARRTEHYRGDRPPPDIKNRDVIVVDDGLASGYTMLAALRSLKKQGGYHKLAIASPVASAHAYHLLKGEADEITCLHISQLPVFAVASFYQSFPDLTDQEVLEYLDA